MTDTDTIARRSCVWEWVVCAGAGAAFNVYRCKTCGKEEWL